VSGTDRDAVDSGASIGPNVEAGTVGSGTTAVRSAAVVAAGRAGTTGRGAVTTWATGLVVDADVAVPLPALAETPAEPDTGPDPDPESRPEAATVVADGGETEATGRGVGFTVGAEGEGAGAAAPAPRASLVTGYCFTRSLICSTVDGSRLARALTLTSSPHF
jgi:hypothetical protein